MRFSETEEWALALAIEALFHESVHPRADQAQAVIQHMLGVSRLGPGITSSSILAELQKDREYFAGGSMWEQERPARFKDAVKPDDVSDWAWKEICFKACCPKARINNCVCFISFICPEHGQRCIGSHD